MKCVKSFFGLIVVGLASGLWVQAEGASNRQTFKKRSVTEPRVVFPKKTELDFEGLNIVGEIRNPGEFYFKRLPEERFDSLVKRRKNFHQEMLRDVVLSQ